MYVFTPIVGVPESSSSLSGVCIKADGTWEGKPHNTGQKCICAWTGEYTCHRHNGDLRIPSHISLFSLIKTLEMDGFDM